MLLDVLLAHFQKHFLMGRAKSISFYPKGPSRALINQPEVTWCYPELFCLAG